MGPSPLDLSPDHAVNPLLDTTIWYESVCIDPDSPSSDEMVKTSAGSTGGVPAACADGVMRARRTRRRLDMLPQIE